MNDLCKFKYKPFKCLKMKKVIYLILITVLTTVSLTTFSSCREDKKTPGEKIESGLKEAGDGVKDAAEKAGDKIEDAADDAGDEIDKAADNVNDKVKDATDDN